MKVKICGLTDEREAKYLNDNGADFAGMVLFCEKSKRNISVDKAASICGHLDSSIKKVAVVVEPTLDQVKQIEKANFDYVQIHGEIKEEIYSNTSIDILKAFNVSDLDKYDLYNANDRVKGFVFDAAQPGSGKAFDWNMLKDLPRGNKLFMLAGGLNPDNVAQAISVINPDGVDVSSSVENDNGIGKDESKIRAFILNARSK